MGRRQVVVDLGHPLAMRPSHRRAGRVPRPPTLGGMQAGMRRTAFRQRWRGLGAHGAAGSAGAGLIMGPLGEPVPLFAPATHPMHCAERSRTAHPPLAHAAMRTGRAQPPSRVAVRAAVAPLAALAALTRGAGAQQAIMITSTARACACAPLRCNGLARLGCMGGPPLTTRGARNVAPR